MNWDNVEGNWKQCKGKVKAGWRKLTDDHLDVIADKRIESACKIEKASPKEECVMKEAILSRREVLRGALAVGCSLLVPAFFSSPVHSATSAAPSATAKKVSPASVKYQTHPKGEQQCSKCVNFIAESNTCKVVEGLKTGYSSITAECRELIVTNSRFLTQQKTLGLLGLGRTDLFSGSLVATATQQC